MEQLSSASLGASSGMQLEEDGCIIRPELHASSGGYKMHGRLSLAKEIGYQGACNPPSHLRKTFLEEVFMLHANQFTMHRLKTCHVLGAVLKEVLCGRREEREGVRRVHGTDEG